MRAACDRFRLRQGEQNHIRDLFFPSDSTFLRIYPNLFATSNAYVDTEPTQVPSPIYESKSTLASDDRTLQ